MGDRTVGILSYDHSPPVPGACGSGLNRAIICIWVVLVMACFGVLMSYGQRAGEIGTPCSASDAGIGIDGERFTLVMSIHPKCACSDSSMYELERLVERCNGGVRCVFVVYEPDGQPMGWYQDERRVLLARFPNARVLSDRDGLLASRLGAVTSGSTVLYSPSGAAVFWGGITPRRAHAGDNLGSDSIAALVCGLPPVRKQTLVFGCPITDLGAHGLLGSCGIEQNALAVAGSEERTQ